MIPYKLTDGTWKTPRLVFDCFIVLFIIIYLFIKLLTGLEPVTLDSKCSYQLFVITNNFVYGHLSILNSKWPTGVETRTISIQLRYINSLLLQIILFMSFINFKFNVANGSWNQDPLYST